MTCKTRPARAGDHARVAELIHEAYAPYVPRMGREPAPMLDDYAALIARGRVQVLEEAGVILGVLLVVTRPPDALLETVAVARGAQWRGLGRRLVALAEAQARAAGCVRMTLYTHVTMTENRALYPRLGYAETHRATEHGLKRVYFAKTL